MELPPRFAAANAGETSLAHPASMATGYSAPSRSEVNATGGLGSETVANDCTGLLIIRAWIEAGSSKSLRAHVRLTSDVSAGIERTLTLTQPDDVGTTVQEWLAGFISDAESGVTEP